MNTFIKAAFLSVLAAATVLPTVAPAEAGEWRHRRHHQFNNGDAAALGALGLATGVIIGGAIASQNRHRYRERVYIDPPVDDYYQQRPVYRRHRPVRVEHYGGLEPWSQSWYRYCSQRYRSFNPETGTFRGYDGRNYFCNAG